MTSSLAQRRSATLSPADEWINSLPLPCCLFDAELRIVAFSTRACALFESEAADVLGKTPDLWQAVNIGDKKRFSQLLYAVLRSEQATAAQEFTHKLPSGDVVLCEWHFAQQRQADGETAIVSLVRELNSSRRQPVGAGRSDWGLLDLVGLGSLRTELSRKRGELQQLNRILQQKDERHSAIFAHAPVGIFVANADGYFTGEMNPAYFTMLGYDADELRTMSVDAITHPDDLTWNKEIVADVLAGRLPQAHYEKRYIRKDGGVVWVQGSISPLKDADGKVYNVVAVMQDITAQKEAELGLKQKEELLHIGGKLAKLGSWMRDPGVGSATFWSDELFELYEYEGTEPLAIDKVFELVLPQYRELAWRLFHDMNNKGLRMEYECEILTCKGNHRWLRVVGEPMHDANGRIVKFIGAAQDITERKQQEIQAKHMNDRVSAALDTMSDAFMIIDRNWQRLYMNKAVESVLKLDRSELGVKNFWDKEPWLKSTPLYEGYHRAMFERVPMHCEYYSQRLHEWIEAHAYPCDEGIAVYFHPITEKKRLAAQVQESEQKLRYVAKAVLDVMWERNLLDDSISWDSGLRKLGYPGNSDDGKSVTSSLFWLQRIHPQEKDAVISGLDRVLKGSHDHWEATYRFLNADGSYIHVMDRGVVFRDRELQPVRMIGGMADISERIRLEEHLQQTQRIDSIGKLTGGLAHDFNNLLTVIIGNVELLQMQGSLPQAQQKLLDSVASSALRGADLTKRLLAFARRQALEPAPTDLNRLVRSMEGLLQRSLGGNIDVRIITSRGLHNALVDMSQLENAILNLCINSRDAMSAGGQITLETMNVTLTRDSAGFAEEVVPGEYVAVKVADNGCGIPQDMLGRVFEPFFTTKERGKGTGLGLSTVFGFMRQSNGYVTISSRVGVGTEVVLYLPITLQQEKAPETRADDGKRYFGGNETILLVEDEPSVSSFSSQFLGSLGYRVVLAENGQKALDILQQRADIDLLFTDIIMPGGIDGAELAQRAQALRPELKVLYTSGFTDNVLLKEGKLDPNVNFLTKPYSLGTMANRIRQTLDQGAAQSGT